MGEHLRVHGFEASLWNNTDRPSCIVCGQLIESDPDARSVWEQIPNFGSGVRTITLPYENIHTMLRAKTCEWRSVYRAFINSPEQYLPLISGLTYRHPGFGSRGEYHLAVPHDYFKIVLVKGSIHPKGEFFWFTKPLREGNNVSSAEDERQTGWPMHECCWILFLNHFGREKLDSNAHLLMHVFGQEHIAKCSNLPTHDIPRWEFGGFEIIKKDPLFVPELNDVIAGAHRSFHDQAANRSNDQFAFQYKGVMTPGGFTISPGAFSRLPLGIAMDIASYLPGKDLRNIMLATRWRFPDTYWKNNLPSYLFEINEDLANGEIDWQYLVLGFLSMMDRPNGLHHRITVHWYLERMEKFLSQAINLHAHPE